MNPLPPAARERLASLLQPPTGHRQLERSRHTIPIGRRAWERYCHNLTQAAENFAIKLSAPDGNFNAVRLWALDLTNSRARISSLLLAAEPFVPFDQQAAEKLLRSADEGLLSCANAVRSGKSGIGPSAQLIDAISWWSARESPHDDHEVLAVAFGVPVPPVDASGEFRADWVLQHYAYNNGALLVHILKHLDALGIAAVPDLLAGMAVVGSLLKCDSPVAAYAAMDSFVTSYLSAPPEVAESALVHLRANDSSLQRAKRMARRALALAVTAEDAETRAFALADLYKRTTEGPFRQLASTLLCLRNGSWEPPPMLTGLRERMVADDGLLKAVAVDVVIPEMRNSEAHETLEWDGISEEYVTEGGRIAPGQVASAVSGAASFVGGCEAGLAAVRALAIPADQCFLPDADEPGRMPAVQRALAYFGTNRLRLTASHLNAREARLSVAQLRSTDINPCFQALLTAHRLLPRIERFTVSSDEYPATVITVSADALSATMPIWDQAISALDRMPFATFLPSNFDARRQTEAENVAIRSVVWIATDDVLDAIDGSPETWDDHVLEVLEARLHVVQVALAPVATFLGSPDIRLGSVAESVRDLRRWLSLTRPSHPLVANSSEAIVRLRRQWEAWGPVARHPLVSTDSVVVSQEPRPEIRTLPAHKLFRTI